MEIVWCVWGIVGALLCTALLFEGKQDDNESWPHTVAMSVLVGAFWPVYSVFLVIGVAVWMLKGDR